MEEARNRMVALEMLKKVGIYYKIMFVYVYLHFALF